MKTDSICKFINKHGTACGGNWAAMLLSTIKSGLPEIYANLDSSKSYTFAELYKILENHNQ
jgi:hypothetical protein